MNVLIFQCNKLHRVRSICNVVKSAFQTKGNNIRVTRSMENYVKLHGTSFNGDIMWNIIKEEREEKKDLKNASSYG